MQQEFSGTVLWANGAPAAGVTVRVFDKDAPGKIDDDLTLMPGLSDAGGHFTVQFDTSRFQDFHTVPLPFGHSINLPDLGDTLLPYLEFRYQFNGQPRSYTSLFGPFQSSFRLPEFPPVQFVPTQNGFKFINRFPGYPLPFSVPDLPGHPDVSSVYGLCGGMSSAAYDFILAGRTIPASTAVPEQGSPLQQYLFRRSMDTFGSMGASLVKVAQWTMMPDDTMYGIQKLTHDEFDQVKARLDDHNLVVLALIYEKANSLPELMQQIWNNHQVLAYRYTVKSDQSIDIGVYDPNYPQRDDIVIEAQPVALGETTVPGGSPATVYGLKCNQLVIGEPPKIVHGFFVMNYTCVEPPQGF